MTYTNGSDFEKAVLNTSRGVSKFREFLGKGKSFSFEIQAILQKSDLHLPHPNTFIGEALYRQVARQLEKNGINAESLVFLSSVDTKADFHHGTDGLFYLPSLHPHLVTIDLFNIDSSVLLTKREKWIDDFKGKVYFESHFHSDLFHEKKGLDEWRRTKGLLSGIAPLKQFDLRQYDSSLRPENHFILTPYHAGTYEKRREFAKLVAGYFVAVSGSKKTKNTV